MDCPACGKAISEKAKFCQFCGADTVEAITKSGEALPQKAAPGRVCPHCGISLSSSAMFCYKCGGNTDETPSKPPIAQIPPAPHSEAREPDTGIILCRRCGQKVSAENDSCPRCGNKKLHTQPAKAEGEAAPPDETTGRTKKRHKGLKWVPGLAAVLLIIAGAVVYRADIGIALGLMSGDTGEPGFMSAGVYAAGEVGSVDEEAGSVGEQSSSADEQAGSIDEESEPAPSGDGLEVPLVPQDPVQILDIVKLVSFHAIVADSMYKLREETPEGILSPAEISQIASFMITELTFDENIRELYPGNSMPVGEFAALMRETCFSEFEAYRYTMETGGIVWVEDDYVFWDDDTAILSQTDDELDDILTSRDGNTVTMEIDLIFSSYKEKWQIVGELNSENKFAPYNLISVEFLGYIDGVGPDE